MIYQANEQVNREQFTSDISSKRATGWPHRKIFSLQPWVNVGITAQQLVSTTRSMCLVDLMVVSFRILSRVITSRQTNGESLVIYLPWNMALNASRRLWTAHLYNQLSLNKFNSRARKIVDTCLINSRHTFSICVSANETIVWTRGWQMTLLSSLDFVRLSRAHSSKFGKCL